MKKIMVLLASVFMIGGASAQSNGSNDGNRHMIEFNADSVLQGVLSFTKEKTRGQSSKNNTDLRLNFGYAYSLQSMPRLQLGGRINYNKAAIAGRGDAEDYGAQIGAIVNSTEDLQNAAYASIYLGLGWAKTLHAGAGYPRNDEVYTQTLAVGKRFEMSRWGIKHVVYSPEIALQNRNSTTHGSLQYSQDLQLRFLQFSVFF